MDEAKEPVDKPETAPEGKEESAAAPVNADKAGERFLLGFKDRDEAEKGYENLRGHATKVAMENAQLKARLEAMEQLRTSDSSVDPEKQIEQVAKMLSKKATDSDTPYETLAAEMIRVTQGMNMDVRDQIAKRYEKELNELRTKLDDVDPAYVQSRKEIDEIMESTGVDKKTARKIYDNVVKKLKSNTTVTGPQVQKPRGPEGSSGVSDDSDWKDMDLTNEEMGRVRAFHFEPSDEKAVIESIKREKARNEKRRS